MDDTIQLAHGAGGRMSAILTEQVLRPILGNPILDRMHDGAVLDMGGKIAFTTDSYVVAPRFFFGGSIGRIAVCGTVNDLAMTGAEAKYLSLSLILEEGFAVEELKRVLQDVRAAADEAGVSIVTGDTKVVGHGACEVVVGHTERLACEITILRSIVWRRRLYVVATIIEEVVLAVAYCQP